jgi:hypothetical protein
MRALATHSAEARRRGEPASPRLGSSRAARESGVQSETSRTLALSVLPRSPSLQRACEGCDGGSMAEDETESSSVLRPSLAISSPTDPYELEAERVADEVMRMTDSAAPLRRIRQSPEDSALKRECASCAAKESASDEVSSLVAQSVSGRGHPLDSTTRSFMEPRFGHDFSDVAVHSDATAAESARAINALAYTVGRDIVFAADQYAPHTPGGKHLLAHELTHIAQGAPHSSSTIQMRSAPYIKKITVHLTPPQNAELLWEGTPPADAPGSDSFTVSTGKGHSNPDDKPGTCTRDCCRDPMTQCAPPWNKPEKVGACCTYFGDTFWTGVSEAEHTKGGWKWWTPIQPNYGARAIALHQHDDVTGEPIGHGCVRMKEPNAKRIHDYVNGRRTNVTIDGRAAPVKCDPKCGTAGGKTGELEGDTQHDMMASVEPVPGQEGELS